MHRKTSQAALGASLLVLLACGGGGDSNLPLATPTTSSNVAVFDPTTGKVPLPNVLATAAAADPLTGRTANKPMNPPEALAYVNLHEMGNTNAVAGINAPIYLQFGAPVDAATVTTANIKVFQISTDAAGTEDAALGFTDISGMFTYQYTAGGTDLFLFPNFPLQPAKRYLYLVTNRVMDAATHLPVNASLYFNALKATTPLTGSFAALEPVRANKMAGTHVLFSGYAKVMDDLITAAKVTSRDQIALMGRFITTGAGFISATTASPSDTGAAPMPVETALRAFALGSNPTGYPQGLPGKTWSHTITVGATFDRLGTNPSPDVYYAGALGAGATAPLSVGTIVLGTLNSADLSIDPVVAAAFHAAHPTLLEMTGTTGAYNPAAGVLQAYRPDGLHLTGFYHQDRSVPFVYFAPTAAAPAGGYPLVIFQHGVTRQKEDALGVVQTLTTVGFAVVAIDLPLHGQLAVPTHTTGDQWGQDFMAIGAPLAARSNMQQSAFNLDRLEFTVRFGGFAGLGAAMPSMSNIKYVGQSLGSIVGALYLAGNTTMSSTGLPYTQTTLDSDMKGYLSVPGSRIAYLLQNSPAFGASIDAGLAAVGIVKNSPTYHQFFQVTQSVFDPVDPATMTNPLAAGLPSRLSNRICIQESVGDQVIGNAYTRYLGNALGGRGVLGAAGAAVAPGFMQLAYTAGGSPDHAAGVVTQFMYTLNGATPAPKVGDAATTAADTTPTEGYFQFDQAGISHGSLLSPGPAPDYPYMTNYLLLQKQMRYFLGFTGTSIVVDPTHGTTLPIAPVRNEGVLVPAKFDILGY
ncbi:MAG TPA: hypothetical protein VJ486_02735 [Geothrix sp.]|nr:hypothetical protein [Geothrix sp.]